MWARIVDGACFEFVGFDPQGKYHPQLEWLVVPPALEPYVTRVPMVVVDGVVEPVDLESVKVVRLADIKSACDTALAPLAAAYPDREVQSWPQQIAEATAYAASSTADVPLLRSMAAERPSLGDTQDTRVAELARRILANAAAWSAAAGPIIGKRQALEDAVGAATTLEGVIGVVVDFTGSTEEPTPAPTVDQDESGLAAEAGGETAMEGTASGA